MSALFENIKSIASNRHACQRSVAKQLLQTAFEYRLPRIMAQCHMIDKTTTDGHPIHPGRAQVFKNAFKRRRYRFLMSHLATRGHSERGSIDNNNLYGFRADINTSIFHEALPVYNFPTIQNRTGKFIHCRSAECGSLMDLPLFVIKKRPFGGPG